MFRNLVSTAALFLLATAAFAQDANNVLRIEQTGAYNTLRVDQSAATGSFVGGLPSVENILSLAPSGLPVLDETTGEVVEVAVPIPNAFTGFAAPSVSALRPSSLLDGPAGTQTNTRGGRGNALDITISGFGGAALFSQTNTGGAPNDGRIVVSGSGTAVLFQDGFGNRADVSATSGASAAIFQRGQSNIGALTATNGTNGVLIQVGDGNDSGAVTLSTAGTELTYIQRGNGLAPASEALSVVGNAPSITIIQTNAYSGLD